MCANHERWSLRRSTEATAMRTRSMYALAAMAYLFETEEHAAIRVTARKFAQTHITPRGAEWEEAEEFPIDLSAAAAAAGITGIGYPEALGGQGGDFGHVMV